jgi:phosphatidate phosphatase APP1
MGLFNKKDRLQIIAFQSYGTETQLYVRGRALEDEHIDLAQKGFLNLLLNSYKRFKVDEIRNTPITITLPDGKVFSERTDEEGYFLSNRQIGNLGKNVNGEGWLIYEIAFGDESIKPEISYSNRFPGAMLIPSKTSDFGVISDIDDTIMHTGVVSSLKWRVLINTIFIRAHKRLPFKGAAHLYHLLHRGASGKKANPIFYVSHSPWNLYRYLELFLKTNNFPKGPILLRSMSRFWKSGNEKPQKQHEIENILKTYPDLPFLLIGDSGEHDPDIYIEMARTFPGRISAIYLRHVADKRRMIRVESLIHGSNTPPIVLVQKSEEIVQHARKMGFIK